MAEASKSGIKTAVETIAAGEPPLEPVTQLPLPIAGDLRDDEAMTAAAEAVRRGPGRPPGARNRSTEEWRNYLLQRYRSPLIALAELYSRDVRQLARELGNEHPTFDQLVKLLQVQVEAATDLMPYLHSKQPLAVQVDAKGVVQLVIEASPEAAALLAPARRNGDGSVLIEGEVLDVENQEVSGDAC